MAIEDKSANSASAPVASNAGRLRGNLDTVDRNRLRGWAVDTELDDAPVSLLVIINDKLVTRVMANRYRADLERAGIKDGRRSFDVTLTPPLSPNIRHVIEIRSERNGAQVPGSPRILEREMAFDKVAKDWMSLVLADAKEEGAIAERLDYLARQTELLLQRRADIHSHRAERQLRVQTDLRWKTQAAADPASPAAKESALAVTGDRVLRALVIDERMPVVNRDAGSNALSSHIQTLQRLGFEVSVAAADMRLNASGDIGIADVTGCSPPWYASVEEVLRRQANTFDLVYLHRLSMAVRYTALVRQHQARARLLYSVADLHYLRLSRQAKEEDNPVLAKAANRMQVTELIAISAVDGVITHSSHEAAILHKQVPSAKVHTVPWAVQPMPTSKPFAQRRGMAFIGHYAHKPNVDAALWLIDEIVPLLRIHDPDFECLLVGSAMPDSLREPRPGIVPLGQVDRLADIFDRVRLTIAPLNYGAGIKGKVLDSLAAGVPCVCTAIAAEGLDLPGELLRHVGNSAPELVAAVRRLHDDAAANATASAAGLRYISEHLSESRIDKLMRDAARLPVQEKGS